MNTNNIFKIWLLLGVLVCFNGCNNEVDKALIYSSIEKHIQVRDIFSDISKDHSISDQNQEKICELRKWFEELNNTSGQSNNSLQEFCDAILGYCQDPINNSNNFHASVYLLGQVVNEFNLNENEAKKYNLSMQSIEYMQAAESMMLLMGNQK